MLRLNKYRPEWASHIPLLVKLMQITDGPVLELGVGVFSTPVLHMLCEDQGREMVSFEKNEMWYDHTKNFETRLHKVHHVTEWDKIIITDRQWDMVFIDHDDTESRSIEAKRVKDNAKYVVIHDSDKNTDFYGYSKIYPLFRYRFDYDKFTPNTSVMSNTVDLTNFKV